MIQSIDKSTLGYSAVFNLAAETKLIGNQYSWLGALFYLGYFVWEYPTNLLLQKFPVATYMSVTVCFGYTNDSRLNIFELMFCEGHFVGCCPDVSCCMQQLLQPRSRPNLSRSYGSFHQSRKHAYFLDVVSSIYMRRQLILFANFNSWPFLES
jgi:hypothetical protein